MLTVENFIDQYLAGDTTVREIAEDAAEISAIEILNTATILDVSTFILDGKIKMLGGDYLDKIRSCIAKYNYIGQDIDVSYSLLQGRAAILGGLRCAVDAVSYSLLSRC